MIARIVQYVSYGLAAALGGLAAWLGADEVQRAQAASYAGTIASALGSILSLLVAVATQWIRNKTGQTLKFWWLAVLLIPLVGATGCAEWIAPGGGGSVALTRPDGTQLKWTTNRDTVFSKAKGDLAAGTFEIDDYNGNGSTLGGIQGAAVVRMNEIWSAAFMQGIGLAAGLLGRGGVAGLPAVGGLTSTAGDTPTEGALRAELLRRITECPILGADQKAALAAAVSAAPGAALVGLLPTLNAALAVPVTVPEPALAPTPPATAPAEPPGEVLPPVGLNDADGIPLVRWAGPPAPSPGQIIEPPGN